MSIPDFNDNVEPQRKITWTELILDAEKLLKQCLVEQDRLSNSIVFFKKQQKAGISFPLESKEATKRHEDFY